MCKKLSYGFTVFAEHGPGIDIFTPGKPGEYDLEGGIWEDEDARNFYENLIDLKAFVPAILFKDNEKYSQNKDSSKDESRGRMLRLLRFFNIPGSTDKQTRWK